MKSNRLLHQFIILIVFSMVFSYGNRILGQSTRPVTVPDKYKTMKSPNKPGDSKVIANGQKLWTTHCKTCHGAKGLGDGPRAASLKGDPGDLSAAPLQAQADGILYFKSFLGHDEMPNFEKIILLEKDRWDLISYIRTLKK
ncbi:MAG TPA: cytochrome c [Bacteroidales bacterium]|nr:cytochrome c [Bacteroidales bacterium]HPS72950.1 cytochrome c [Bacteroidales bacterium]